MNNPILPSPWESLEDKSSTPSSIKKEAVSVATTEIQMSDKKSRNYFRLAPIFISLIALLIIGVGLFMLMNFMNQNPTEAAIDIKVPSKVLLGQPFYANVYITNSSDVTLKNAQIEIFLPPELVFSNRLDNQCQQVDNHVCGSKIGDIDKSGIIKKDIQLTAVSGTLTVRSFQVRMSYNQSGTNAKFKKEVSVEVPIGPPAVTVDFVTPDKVLNGGIFDMKVNIKNQSSEDMDNLNVSAVFPPGFILTESSLPALGSSAWSVGLIRKGEAKILIFSGYISGQDNDFYTVKINLEKIQDDSVYLIGEKIAMFSITAPPLSVSVGKEGSGSVVGLGEKVNYSVAIKNNTEVSLENVVARVALVGEMFDLSQVITEGIFNQINDTISWNSGQIPGLLRILPGETRILTFTVPVKKSFSVKRGGDKNYILKANVFVESSTVLPGIASGKTMTTVKYELKVAGSIQIFAAAYYKDPVSGVTNTGPYPPRVNKPTQYLVRWVIRNYASDVSRVRINSTIDSYSRIIGKPTSNISSSVPIYNQGSGQIIWNIDKLSANQGVLGKPIEASFVVEVVPTNPYIGHDAVVLRETTLRADDDFSGTTILASAPVILTSLPDDKSIGNVDRTVKP